MIIQLFINYFINLKSISLSLLLYKPNIEMQPRIFIPNFNEYNKLLPEKLEEGIKKYLKTNTFLLQFSIDFQFNFNFSSLETIMRNYEVNETKVILEKFKQKKLNEFLFNENENFYSNKPIIITLPEEEDNYSNFHFSRGLLTDNINGKQKGSLIFLIISNSKEEIITIERKIEIIKKFKIFMKLKDNTNIYKYAFRFSIYLINKINTQNIGFPQIIYSNFFILNIANDCSSIDLIEVSSDDYYLS